MKTHTAPPAIKGFYERMGPDPLESDILRLSTRILMGCNLFIQVPGNPAEPLSILLEYDYTWNSHALQLKGIFIGNFDFSKNIKKN
jgi:hypothetical protein